jgi:LAS superfamily LD-carboxypeptidase LdcB
MRNNREVQSSSNISLPYDIGFANRQHYFPMNDLMEELEFVLIGDRNEFSFIRAKSNEYIRLTAGSNIAYINDRIYYLPGPPFAHGNVIYIPAAFLQNTFLNLEFTFDEKNKNKITVDVLQAGDHLLRIRNTRRLEEVEAAAGFGSYPTDFAAELSAYQEYFNPPADKAYEYLRLINHDHPLDPIDYFPDDLIDVIDTRSDRSPRQLRYYAAKALEAFLVEARANGMNDITVTSAFRSYAEQSTLFNPELASQRPASVMPPGHSEHQSGLGVDMHTFGTGAAQEFGNTPQGRWLAENAHHFGFILRYPADKTEITGIIYEPWHFRYVGRRHATRMFELNLCLEEYWEQRPWE